MWVLLCLPLFTGCVAKATLVAEDPASGFALFRSGRLKRHELADLCRKGVEEIVVLDGRGHERECRFRNEDCAGLRVRFDQAQSGDQPVSSDFLQAFDAWIEQAQRQGTKVAFRCNHGWHRAGRLAAYYRLRFEHESAEEAKQEMHRLGGLMWLHPSLDPQVEAYADLVANRDCSTDPPHCVSSEPSPGLSEGVFPEDACAELADPLISRDERQEPSP